MRTTVVVVSTLIILSITGCGESNRSAELASVDGKIITQSEFEAYLRFKRVPTGDDRRTDRLLDQYVEREALASVIENEDLLDRDLIRAELTEFRKEMLISRYFEDFLKGKVSDQAVQNYYNTHAADYEQKKVRAAHILIRTNKKMSEIERKAKLTTAQEAYSKVRAGEDFAEIARDYSEDKISSKKGGNLGWLKQGSIDKRFSDTIFSMEPGTISEPFETPFGFHVVKVLDGAKTVKQPLSSVAGDIRYQLRAKARKAEMERLMAKVKVEKR